MNLEQLKKMLENGEITQEQFEAKVAELGLGGGNGEDDKKNKDLDLEEILKSESFQKLIQSEVDKVRTKYSQDKKNLEKQLEEYRQKTMSKEEILSEKENSLKDLEARLKRQELDFQTVKILEEKKLPSSFLKHVTGETVEERTERITELLTHIDTLVEDKMKDTFKSQNTSVGTGKDSEGIKSLLDLTIAERAKLMEENPELYNTLLKQI